MTNFRERGRDGQLVPESMSGEQMVEQGWEPELVGALHWDWDGKLVDLETKFSFAAEIVPDRQYDAVWKCWTARTFAGSCVPTELIAL